MEFTSESIKYPQLKENLSSRPFKQDERGTFFLLTWESSQLKHLKIHESAKRALPYFDGTHTVSEIATKTDLSEDTVHYLTNLFAKKGFLKNVDKTEKEENPATSVRFKFFSPGKRILTPFSKLAYFFERKILLVISLAFLFGGISLFLLHFSDFFNVFISFFLPPFPLKLILLGMVLFYAVEFAHEFAHAGVYHFYGGKEVDIGFELHFLIPFFYAHLKNSYMIPRKGRIRSLLAGPLVSFFFGSLFVYLFYLGVPGRPVWALQGFFWYQSTFITLIPAAKTDGYYLLQEYFQFPNLMEYARDFWLRIGKLLIRRFSYADMKEYLSMFSLSEKKALLFYSFLLPIGLSFQMFIGFYVIFGFTFSGNWFGNIIGMILISIGILRMVIVGGRKLLSLRESEKEEKQPRIDLREEIRAFKRNFSPPRPEITLFHLEEGTFRPYSTSRKEETRDDVYYSTLASIDSAGRNIVKALTSTANSIENFSLEESETYSFLPVKDETLCFGRIKNTWLFLIRSRRFSKERLSPPDGEVENIYDLDGIKVFIDPKLDLLLRKREDREGKDVYSQLADSFKIAYRTTLKEQSVSITQNKKPTVAFFLVHTPQSRLSPFLLIRLEKEKELKARIFPIWFNYEENKIIKTAMRLKEVLNSLS